MDPLSQDIDSLIAQTTAISWEDPSSQLETLPQEQVTAELLPLVGLVISQKTQNNQTMNAALSKAWLFANPFSFAVSGPNLFLFKFTNKEHITRIINSVWNVNGFLLAIQKWHPSATLRELSLSKVTFWIQVHGLPLHHMSFKNAIVIGKGLGQLVKVEENGGSAAIFRSYMRLLVSIDVSKPLNPGFSIARTDGSSSWVRLLYERLDIYCSDCGLIYHKQSSCLAKPEDRFPSRYIISLKVTVFSNLPTHKFVEKQPGSQKQYPYS